MVLPVIISIFTHEILLRVLRTHTILNYQRSNFGVTSCQCSLKLMSCPQSFGDPDFTILKSCALFTIRLFETIYTL